MLSLWLSQKSLLTSKIGVGTINLDFVNQLVNVISLKKITLSGFNGTAGAASWDHG
jgi:hypothetical protein